MTVTTFARLSLLLAPLALISACSGGDDDDTTSPTPSVDCTTVTVPTFAEVSIWPKCTSCHASTLSGGDRAGAPPGIDYDVYASAKQYAELGMEEVEEGAMPLPGAPTATEEEKQSFYTWVQCGTPE